MVGRDTDASDEHVSVIDTDVIYLQHPTVSLNLQIILAQSLASFYL